MRAHKILTIAKRDYLAIVRTKAFVFSLVIAPILFGGGSIGMAFLKSKPDLKDRRIVVIDRTSVVAEPLVKAALQKNERELFDKKTGQQLVPRYVFEVMAPAVNSQDQLLDLSGRIRRKELAALLEIGKDALRPPGPGIETDPDTRVAYYSNAGGIDEMRGWLNGPINDGVRLARLVRLGIDINRNPGLSASVPIEGLSLVERDEKTGQIQEARKRNPAEGFVVPFALALILAMIVMVGSAPMLQNVTQDKSERIVETLLGAVTPFELLSGKVLASVALSMTSSVLYVGAGTLVVNALGVAGLLPFSIIAWFYVYLLADMVMLCALAAALGACCSTPQDAQNLAIVLLMPCIFPMFMLLNVLRQPNGTLATVMSLFPPFTPILMLLRQAMPDGIPAWQPWVGLAGVLVFATGTVWAASRIFRVAILMQGKPPQLVQMVRWAWKGWLGLGSESDMLHYEIVKALIDTGACPSNPELAAALGIGEPELEKRLRELSDLHGLVLHPHVCEPWVVHPFSLTPTLNWVQGPRHGWWAPCIWCACGVAALAGGEVSIHTRLAGEEQAVVIHGTEDLWVHFAIPPAQAWQNVHQHCAMVLPFARRDEIPAWCARHRLPRGEAVPLSQVMTLAKLWYGHHARPDWKKWTVAEAQEIFAQAGLRSAFWDLGAGSGRF